MECPVCIETIKEEFKSPCGHSMCSGCFDKWKEEQVKKCCSVTCPSCRFVIIEVSDIKVDMFAPPLGYVDVEERHLPPYPRGGFGIFPSMPEREYLDLLESREEIHEDLAEDEEDEEDEDWDSKDDWEYEDMDEYIVAIAYAH